MKAAAMSVWVFINLLCFGMCGYLYLIWSQYWMYIERQKLFSKTPGTPQRISIGSNDQEVYINKFSLNTLNYSNTNIKTVSKSRRSAIGVLWSNSLLAQPTKLPARQVNNVVRKSQGSPRFPNIHKPILEFDSDKYMCDDYLTPDCESLTTEFKDLLLKEFHRVLMSESKVFKSGLESQNTYDVKYDNMNRRERSKDELLCELKKISVQTVRSYDEPFSRLGFRIPDAALQEGRVFNMCAVVTNAGSLLGSRMGEFIDSHDMVIRFNNAPTVNYTEDVGYKTTFRILNSQVVTKPEYNFINSPMFKGISILIWDPANFSSTLEDWYHHPDFPLFPVYKKFLDKNPEADVHLLQPKVLWDLWAVLQDSSPYRLRRNPPSSGFIGVWFALQRCNRVRVFEYVPSARATRRCHYYSNYEDAACTVGAWHPLAQEKALAERIRDNSDLDVFQRGFIDVLGLRNVVC